MTGICQSCSMPLKKDSAGGGSNADGSRSLKYCSLCYCDGKFIHADFSATDMQLFCIKALNKKGVPRFLACLLTRGIPKLERWNPHVSA